MEKKISAWKTKGMNRDMSVSAFSPEFTFENRNLRLATNDNNTSLSWVNEKGTSPITISIQTESWIDDSVTEDFIDGVTIGTAILNRYLVLFTKSDEYDYIYRLNWDVYNNYLEGTLLYKGNLNFDEHYPIETISSYEAEHIQKVYWTDKRNQPRMINIVPTLKNLQLWNHYGDEDYYINGVYTVEDTDIFFDFVPAVNLENLNIEIQRNPSGGFFTSGVIQYCFTFINKHAQQSNIIHVSPLYYLSFNDRGASPEDIVNNSFSITIDGADTNFEYVRIYSIQRGAIDSQPLVKLIEDIPITGDTLTYIDDGTNGSTMDPTELLYVGGKEIFAETMADKDMTLFIGNFTQKNTSVNQIQKYFRGRLPEIEFKRDRTKLLELKHSTGYYVHTSQLDKNSREITTFKGGEIYRFGFQLQKSSGEWTEPIFIGNKINDKYPDTSVYQDVVKLVYAQSTIDFGNVLDSDGQNIDLSIYKKIRPVIVFPDMSDRHVVCQGVINPTVFTVEDRKNKYPFAQASWYFRPYMCSENTNTAITPSSSTSTIATVSITLNGSTEPEITLDSLTQQNHKSYYVLIATFESEYQKDVTLDRGYIYTRKRTYYGPTVEYLENLDNIVPDSNEEVKRHIKAVQVQGLTYILLGTEEFPKENYVSTAMPADLAETYYYKITETYDAGRIEPGRSEDNVFADGSIKPSSRSFDIYNGLRMSGDHLLYYTKVNENADNLVTFDFYYLHYNGSTPLYDSYQVVFNSVEDFSYIPSTNNTTGTAVQFNHYGYITCDNERYTVGPGEYEYNFDLNFNWRATEIEGSLKSYENPYQKVNPEIVEKSNSQFFIDQSIVTLNSPDIEFDTNVQTCSFEDLKLRIVGAIPITANASAHEIATSTAMLPRDRPEKTFGTGERDLNVLHKNIDIHAGKRLVADLLWDDVIVVPGEDGWDNPSVSHLSWYHFVFPWHREGSLNSDKRTVYEGSSWLKTKKESNMLFSHNTEYFEPEDIDIQSYIHISSKLHLTENGQVYTIRLPKQKNTSSEINYYPNIEKVIFNEKGYMISAHPREQDDSTDDDYIRAKNEDFIHSNPISMKYKSTSHAVIAFNATNSEDVNANIPIAPYAQYASANNTYSIGNYVREPSSPHTTLWEDDNITFTQSSIDITNLFKSGNQHMPHNFLWLAELYKDVPMPFGGTDQHAIRANNWLVGGDTVDFTEGEVTLRWTEGDTYYQRYDCLKTYPYTVEDQNQIVEILSFMCETHVNIDGRYDKNRGQLDNTNMRPDIFNRINEAYSQQDNFFISKKTNIDDEDSLHYPNEIYYSKTKTVGADVDLWTNVTLASTLSLDGDKGKLNALKRFNDQIIAFQDSGISQILYNENVQVASTQGVPIEIANSGKVQGKRYLSDTIGCSNKWSIATAPSGIYFIDSINQAIYLFNGQISNLSGTLGFNTWAKQNIPELGVKWSSIWGENYNNFVTYYDKRNQDVLFINDETCLAYSEKFGAFTSFYDYQGSPYFCNLDNTGIWIRNDKGVSTLHLHNSGQYCNFFGDNYPYSMILVGNPNPQYDKVFTNLEFRATTEGEGRYTNSVQYAPYLPFDYLEAWDEYQHGIAKLGHKDGHLSMMHHIIDSNYPATLKRKFRIWRCDIPRDNAPVDDSEKELGISRFKVRPLDRMRNPWVYLKLMKEAEDESSYLPRTEIHDILMTYFL